MGEKYLKIDPIKVFLSLKDENKNYFNNEEIPKNSFNTIIKIYTQHLGPQTIHNNIILPKLKKYYSEGSNYNLLVLMIERILDMYIADIVNRKNRKNRNFYKLDSFEFENENISSLKDPSLYNGDILTYIFDDIKYINRVISSGINNCIYEICSTRNLCVKYKNYFYSYEWDFLTKNIHDLLDKWEATGKILK